MVRVLGRFLPLLFVVTLLPSLAAQASAVDADHYRNPLRPTIPKGGLVESCADPTVIRGQERQHARTWYMYCTTDPLNDGDVVDNDTATFHRIPMLQSHDLVNWTYVGDALPTLPSWAEPDAALWAPDVVYSRALHRYYLSFVVTNTRQSVSGEPDGACKDDNAIGVATSRSPLGPWTVSDNPVVGPRRAGPGCSFFTTFDPDVLGNSIERSSILYYGSYFGGIFGQRVRVTPNGIHTSTPARRVNIGNRYEGANVVRHGGYYYMFGSATNCCAGPLTGYSVFVGRSRSPLGPFRDREGHSFLDGRVGGTPVISMNGNRWVGTGHSSAFRDFGGQWWLAYHAVDRNNPYFARTVAFTKRPPLLDPLDWVNGWPTVRAGRWASDKRMPAPAAQPGERTRYLPRPVAADRLGRPLPRFSDSFAGDSLRPRWSWVRPPDPSTYGVENGSFRFHTQNADLTRTPNTASVLTEPAPKRDYVVQTKVHLDVPAEGCCQNFVQAGMLIYGSDDAFIKLSHVSIFETRQTEFAKEVTTVDGPQYGNTVIGPPEETTYLRIVKRTAGDRTLFTGYTSTDGRTWVRGGTWVHNDLREDVRIGLVSMGGPGDFTAHFDNVRVWALRHR